jgi:protein-S-isoprenylcysteine O-methyltransferase Ste14
MLRFRHILEATLATIVVPGGAVVLVPWLILRTAAAPSPRNLGLLELVAIPLAALGAAMIVWVSAAFVRLGHGTPVPIDPPTTFVAAGLFRYVRNPMYVGVLTVLLAETIFFRSLPILIYALAIGLALHVFLVAFEEPQLKRRFGDSYVRYLAATPRWIPRLPRL